MDAAHLGRQRTLRRALAQLRPYRRRMILLAVTLGASAGLGVAAPVITKFIFDDAQFPTSGEPRLGLLIALVGGMIIIVAFTSGPSVLQTHIGAHISQRIVHDTRDQVFSHVQRLSFRFFTATPVGEIHSRLTNDIGGLERLTSKGIVSTLANVGS